MPDRVSPVRADLDRMIQVMLNLSNAVKFCDPGAGRIEVTLSEGDGWLRVDVRDNGPACGRRTATHLRQVPPGRGDTLTEKPHGTGLGLPISRHIVERHGGQIWVDNHPGRGVLLVTLPVMKLAEAA